jgi:hypothetical protein
MLITVQQQLGVGKQDPLQCAVVSISTFDAHTLVVSWLA